MVYLWYPTAPNQDNSARGTYLPGAKDIDRAPGSTRIKEQVFGHFWPLVVSGEITSHAKENATLAKDKNPFPVILFSHGGGWTSFGYTGLIEDLVSHGYVVAAIEHTYEAAAVVFAEGKVTSYSEENVHRMEKPPGASYDEMVENAMSWIRARDDVFAADQRFALDQLVQLNKGDEKSRFAGQLDLRNVAAMGHSMGGQTAIRTCQLDERIKACVNLDGGSVDGVLITYPRAVAPQQPVLYIEVPFMPLSEERLNELHLPKEEWTQEWRARVQTQLRQCPGGSYYALLTAPQLSHLRRPASAFAVTWFCAFEFSAS
jgi:dienelactone hydrolase